MIGCSWTKLVKGASSLVCCKSMWNNVGWSWNVCNQACINLTNSKLNQSLIAKLFFEMYTDIYIVQRIRSNELRQTQQRWTPMLSRPAKQRNYDHAGVIRNQAWRINQRDVTIANISSDWWHHHNTTVYILAFLKTTGFERQVFVHLRPLVCLKKANNQRYFAIGNVF